MDLTVARSNFRYEDEYITMTRGDTLSFGIELFDGEGNPFTDTFTGMYFSCKKSFNDNKMTFQKSLGDGISNVGDGQYVVRVAPEDTVNLEAGKYFYDLQLDVNGDVYTPIKGVLEIDRDVTDEESESGGGGIIPTGTKQINITQNGTVTEDITVYASVEVNVNVPQPTGTKQISITQNGTTTENVKDYASAEINVNVPQPSGTMSITENGTYDVTNYASADVNVSGGGGSESSMVVVASGEFIGDSEVGRQTISIGTAMPQTDFYVLIKAKDNSEYIRDGYSLTFLTVIVLSAIGHYDLSSNGDGRPFVSNFPVYDNNNGSLTEKSAGFIVKGGGRINNGDTAEMAWNTFNINRRSDAFELHFGHSNTVYNLPSNITYEYEVVYFGNNPQTDIIGL